MKKCSSRDTQPLQKTKSTIPWVSSNGQLAAATAKLAKQEGVPLAKASEGATWPLTCARVGGEPHELDVCPLCGDIGGSVNLQFPKQKLISSTESSATLLYGWGEHVPAKWSSLSLESAINRVERPALRHLPSSRRGPNGFRANHRLDIPVTSSFRLSKHWPPFLPISKYDFSCCQMAQRGLTKNCHLSSELENYWQFPLNFPTSPKCYSTKNTGKTGNVLSKTSVIHSIFSLFEHIPVRNPQGSNPVIVIISLLPRIRKFWTKV